MLYLRRAKDRVTGIWNSDEAQALRSILKTVAIAAVANIVVGLLADAGTQLIKSKVPYFTKINVLPSTLTE